MYYWILFSTSAALLLASCGLMLWTKNLMHSCIYLLGTLIGTAGLYLSLGADFVAVTQVMVYVGGIVILMLFAVMLTGGKDYVSKKQKILGLIPLMGNKKSFIWGIGSGLVFIITLGILLTNIFTSIKPLKEVVPYSFTIEEIGELLITNHELAFELSSVLLLGALVGAAIIARPRREYERKDEDSVTQEAH